MSGADTIGHAKPGSLERPAAPTRNQRHHPRYLTFRTGKIVTDTLEIECAVLDVSVGGARLLTAKDTTVPKKFTLVVDPENAAFACRLIWSDGQMAGVAFREANAPRPDTWLLVAARDRAPAAPGTHGADAAPPRPGWSVKRSDRLIPKDNRRFARLLPSGTMPNVGAIVVAPDKPGIPCAVVDISASGVCLETQVATPLPQVFTLVYDGIIQPCRLIWAKGHRIGASFIARSGRR